MSRTFPSDVLPPKTRAQHSPENVIDTALLVLRSVEDTGDIIQFSPIDNGSKSDAIVRAVDAISDISIMVKLDVEHTAGFLETFKVGERVSQSQLDHWLSRLNRAKKNTKILTKFLTHLEALVDRMITRHRAVLNLRACREARRRAESFAQVRRPSPCKGSGKGITLLRSAHRSAPQVTHSDFATRPSLTADEVRYEEFCHDLRRHGNHLSNVSLQEEDEEEGYW